MQEGRVPGQCDILVAWPAGNVLFPALRMKVGLKPSLATTVAKASDRVIADPMAGKAKGQGTDARGDGSYLHNRGMANGFAIYHPRCTRARHVLGSVLVVWPGGLNIVSVLGPGAKS